MKIFHQSFQNALKNAFLIYNLLDLMFEIKGLKLVSFCLQFSSPFIIRRYNWKNNMWLLYHMYPHDETW
jgi:hypothetical protein